MTTVSTVTVVRNDLPGLTKTGLSLASQTCHDFEWVVIDGASTGLNKIAKDMLTPSPTTFISEPDAGIYDAMNKGWKEASGDWVLFLNAGDTLCQDRTLADVIPQLDHSERDWAFGMVRNVDNQGNVIGIQNASPFNRMGHALGNTTVPHQATFMRKGLLERLGGFNPHIGTAADQELIYRAALQGPPLELVWPVADFQLDGVGMQVSPSAHLSIMRKARSEHRDRFLGNPVTDSAATAALYIKQAVAPRITRLRG
jgi:glycosyltransferase involved in cell wall biosynthesis